MRHITKLFGEPITPKIVLPSSIARHKYMTGYVLGVLLVTGISFTATLSIAAIPTFNVVAPKIDESLFYIRPPTTVTLIPIPNLKAPIEEEVEDASYYEDAFIHASAPKDRPSASSSVGKSRIIGTYPHGLHPVIRDSMIEASRYLPEGYAIEFLSAHRAGPNQGPHGKVEPGKGALAVDIWIVENGKRLPNIRAPKNFALYERFMQWTKKIQYERYPAYRGRGRWGGYFATGTPGDLMHYDLEPETQTAAGNWQEGLKLQYVHFGLKEDVGNGMGKIDRFRLPNIGSIRTVSAD